MKIRWDAKPCGLPDGLSCTLHTWSNLQKQKAELPPPPLFYLYFNLLFKKGLGEVSVLDCEVTLSEYAEFPVLQYFSLEPLSPPLVSAWSKIKICIRASL